jgi:hypothetical protein
VIFSVGARQNLESRSSKHFLIRKIAYNEEWRLVNYSMLTEITHTPSLCSFGDFSFGGFPSEVWSLIFNEMDYCAVRFVSVSKNFYNLVFQSITSLKDLFENFRYGLSKLKRTDINDEFIQKFVSLQSLTVHCVSISDIGIKNLKSLTFLNLFDNKDISNEAIKDLT